MCRIAIVSGFTSIPEKTRRMLLHLLLLTSYADEGGQRDGWGIAAGSHVLQKDGTPYQYAERGWLTMDAPKHLPLLGHIRSASRGTGKPNPLNSHPYRFDILEKPVVFAHNGFFQEAALEIKHDPANPAPTTDSYIAGLRLIEETQKKTGGKLPSIEEFVSVVEKWSKDYAFSSYVCVVGSDYDLYLIRKDEAKSFYLAQSSEGVLGCTSGKALENIIDTAYRMGFISTYPTVEAVRPSTLTRIQGGVAETLEIKIEPRPAIHFFPNTHGHGVWSWGTPANPAGNSAGSGGSSGGGSGGNSGSGSSGSGSSGNSATKSVVPNTATQDDIQSLANILVELYPLRKGYFHGLSHVVDATSSLGTKANGYYTAGVNYFVRLRMRHLNRKPYIEIWNDVVGAYEDETFVRWLVRNVDILSVKDIYSYLPHSSSVEPNQYEAMLKETHLLYVEYKKGEREGGQR